MKKQKRFIQVSLWFFVYIMIFSLGFILGMVYQQLIFIQGTTKLLSYSDVEVNFNVNGTKIAEEMNKTFIPAWKQAFNQTLNEQGVK